jgi:ribonuclease BN (tRNA processing enzyme)
MIDYEVIASSSKGNAVIINKTILIDCGVPFKLLSDKYADFQLVLLTHWHSDHFNRTTIRRIARERPMLRFGCRDYLVSRLLECGVLHRNIDVYEEHQQYGYAAFDVTTANLVHDVPNTAYTLHFRESLDTVFYATDTNNLDNIQAHGYTLYLIEANYSEDEIVERIRRKQEEGEYCHEWDVLKNHLSREKAENWLYRNMGNHSRYVFLHEHTE